MHLLCLWNVCRHLLLCFKDEFPICYIVCLRTDPSSTNPQRATVECGVCICGTSNSQLRAFARCLACAIGVGHRYNRIPARVVTVNGSHGCLSGLSTSGAMRKLSDVGIGEFLSLRTVFFASHGKLRSLCSGSGAFRLSLCLISGLFKSPLRIFGFRWWHDTNLVDPASSHMLVSKIKPCMSQYKLLYGETANGSLKQL